MKILLVEDEPKLASFIQKGFSNEGYDIEVAYDGNIAKSMFRNTSYSIVILDVNVPHINGFELCKFIKIENPEIPVIMLTALDNLNDKISGFEAGTDDYLSKPFEFKELLLRVRALSKRAFGFAGNGRILKLADLELNLGTKIVTRAGKIIPLTSKEYSLLEYLLINQGGIVSRVDIAERVWNINFDTNTNIIDVYVNHLRKKIDKDTSTKLIHTVIGMGYTIKETE